MTTLEILALEKYRVEMVEKINTLHERHKDQKIVSVEVMWQLFHAVIESTFSNQFIGGYNHDTVRNNMQTTCIKKEMDSGFVRFVPKEKVVGMPCP